MPDITRRYVLNSVAAAGGLVAAAAASDASADGQPPFGLMPDGTGRRPTAVVPLSDGVETGQDLDGRIGQRSDRRAIADLGETRRRVDAARARRLRELHWHATAAEWAFVLEGQCRITIIDPAGRSEIDDFDPAMSGISRAATATRSRASAEDCRFHLDFRQRLFLRVRHFQHHRLAGHTPPEVLAKNFGVPAPDVRGLPDEGGLLRAGTGAARCRPMLLREDRSVAASRPTTTGCWRRTRISLGRHRAAGIAPRVSDIRPR